MGFIEFPQGPNTGMELIQTIAASAATTVSFTGISPAYKVLIVTWNNVFQSTSTDKFGIRLNNDSGSNYKWGALGNQIGTAVGSYGTTSDTIFAGAHDYVSPIPLTNTSSNAANTASGNFTIYNADSTTPKSVFWNCVGYRAAGSQGTWGNGQGQYFTTVPITRIDFIRNASQTVTGNFYLYGIN